MRIKLQKPLQLNSSHNRQASLYERQKGSFMLMPSWMNIHDGNFTDSTTHSFCTRCFHMMQPLEEMKMTKSFAGASNNLCLSET